MKLQWLGHSCFVLTESTGTAIVADPYGHVGYDMPEVAAHAVTVSHNHHDHNNVGAVSGSPVVFDSPGIYDFRGVRITGIESAHDGENGAARGSNIIFKYRMDGLDICHLGDIGEDCTPALIESIMPVDVLMIPVGGNYTLDAAQAKEYVDMLMPDIVLPMHYKTKSLNIDIDRAEAFLRMFDDENVEILETDTLMLDRDGISSQTTKIWLLRRDKPSRKQSNDAE